jgi:hypothetical protein
MTTTDRKRHASARFGRRWLCTVATLLVASTLTARAEPRDANLLTDRFYVTLGTFIVGTNTKVRVNGEDEIGDKVDLERVFGDSDTNRFRLDGYWRFADRHKLRFLWFDWDYRGSRTLEEEIDFEGDTYPVGADASLSTSFKVYELAYEYAFLRRADYEITGSFGVHYAEFSAGLAAQVSVSGDPLDPLTLNDTARVDAPLPVFGLRAIWHFGGDWWLDASGQYFALSIGDYAGNLQDYRVAVLWQPRSYAGVGVGYNAFRVNVDLDTSDYNGSLDWTYYGPQLFFSVSF